mgnify:FL=1
MWKQYSAAIGALACYLSLVSYASAGEVDVLKAEARRSNGGSYQFSVTLRHDDTG